MKKLVFALTCLLLTVPCAGEIIIVDDDWPYDFNNIQDAIDYAGYGDFVFVFPAIYTGERNRDIHFGGKVITIQSVFPEDPCIVAATIIDCNGDGRGFQFDSGEDANSVLAGLTIINGYAFNSLNYGGGIYCGSNSSPTIANNTITGNTAGSDGGGIYWAASSGTVINTILWGNSPREICGNPRSLTISHSNIQYGLEGLELTEGIVNWLDGNMDIYPVFMNVSDKNYNLHADLPCIDTGIQDTFFVYNNGQDTLFIPAINFSGSSPDIGANEFVDATVITTELKKTKSFYLSQNYPNPFNSVTTFEFSLEHPCHVDLIILTILGEEVTTVLSETLSTGKHHYEWDASEIASGIYLYYLSARKTGPGKANSFEQVGKMVHIK